MKMLVGVGVALAACAVAVTWVAVARGSTTPFAGECRHAHAPRVGFPDALPKFGETSRQRVEAIIASDGPAIREQYEGTTKLAGKMRLGQLWDRLPSGEVIIRMPDDDYWILATVAGRKDCPATPVHWNGVPIRFVVRPSSH